MPKIALKYEDRQFFHPEPSADQDRAIKAILEKFNWTLEIPPKKSKIGGSDIYRLTRTEAKQLIDKGIKAAKRRGVRIYDTKEDIINQDLALSSN